MVVVFEDASLDLLVRDLASGTIVLKLLLR